MPSLDNDPIDVGCNDKKALVLWLQKRHGNNLEFKNYRRCLLRDHKSYLMGLKATNDRFYEMIAQALTLNVLFSLNLKDEAILFQSCFIGRSLLRV